MSTAVSQQLSPCRKGPGEAGAGEGVRGGCHGSAGGVTTVFFDASQTRNVVAAGVTPDTIRSEGYLFTFTRDKLFTGGVGLTNPIGRYIRVPWPLGLEAQAANGECKRQRARPANARGLALWTPSFALSPLAGQAITVARRTKRLSIPVASFFHRPPWSGRSRRQARAHPSPCWTPSACPRGLRLSSTC